MQKVAGILFILFYLTACSVSKPVIRDNSDSKNTEGSIIDLIEVLEQNITSNSFYIQKAEVQITNQEEKQRFFASLKFNKPDSFLISVRSTTGIEAVRIFATRDTVLINDRINRIFFYGSQKAARMKYGVSSVLFPLILGDFIVSDKLAITQQKCENGVININSFIEGSKIDYQVNCENMKANTITLNRETDSKPALFRYSDFRKVSGFLFAGRVMITDLNNIDLIEVKLSKIEIPWDGEVVFVPGSNYERIEIK